VEYDKLINAKHNTLLHIHLVGEYILKISKLLIDRGNFTEADMLLDRILSHDLSKLSEPEYGGFMKATEKLKSIEYGSQEYAESLKELGEVLSHHYEHNSHHPEHHNGIYNMGNIDILEMICDWYASSKRNKTSDYIKGLNIQKDRFKFDDTMYNYILNILNYLDHDGDVTDLLLYN